MKKNLYKLIDIVIKLFNYLILNFSSKYLRIVCFFRPPPLQHPVHTTSKKHLLNSKSEKLFL